MEFGFKNIKDNFFEGSSKTGEFIGKPFKALAGLAVTAFGLILMGEAFKSFKSSSS